MKKLNQLRLLIIAIYRMIKDDNFILISFSDKGMFRVVYRTNFTTRVENAVFKNAIRLNEPEEDESHFMDEFKK